MTGIVTKEVTIKAPVADVWAALTDAATIGDWMDDDSVAVDLRVGGAYTCFGGETSGAFTAIEPMTALTYTWRMESWPAEWPDSVVAWTLAGDAGVTTLSLVHSNFPNDGERDGHDEGWDSYWLEPMIAWLESCAA